MESLKCLMVIITIKRRKMMQFILNSGNATDNSVARHKARGEYGLFWSMNNKTWRNKDNKKVAHTLLHAIIRSTTQLFGFPHFPLSAAHSAHHMSLTFRITLLKLCLNDLWGQAGYRGHEGQGLKDGQRLCAQGRGGEGKWAPSYGELASQHSADFLEIKIQSQTGQGTHGEP